MILGLLHRAWVVLVALTLGCGSSQPIRPAAAAGTNEALPAVLADSTEPADLTSDLEKFKKADVSILFVGNSHTASHDLPDLVRAMLESRQPGKQVYTHVVNVLFLEDLKHDGRCKAEIVARPWNYVVLQAQKISASGRHNYSRQEGIEIARLARERGSNVFFYPEWGRKDVAGDGATIEKIYQEMATAAGVGLVPVGRAWDLALTKRPELPLYEADGNHQSQVGAFLTACVLFGRLSGESPACLAAVPRPGIDARDHVFLAESAAKALAQEVAEPRPR